MILTNAPANHTNKNIVIPSLDDQRPATVSLTGVLIFLFCAQHVLCYLIFVGVTPCSASSFT